MKYNNLDKLIFYFKLTNDFYKLYKFKYFKHEIYSF